MSEILSLLSEVCGLAHLLGRGLIDYVLVLLDQVYSQWLNADRFTFSSHGVIEGRGVMSLLHIIF